MISRLFCVSLATAIAAFPIASLADSAAAGPVAAPVLAAATIDRSGGMTVIKQQDSAASLVGVDVVIRAGLDRQSLAQSGIAALTAETILRAPVGTNGALEDAISAQGGSVHFAVDPDDVRFYAESLAAKAPAVLALLTQALSAPQITPAAVNDARNILNKRIGDNDGAPLQVGLEMLDRADSSAANTALSPLGSGASLAQLLPDDVRAFYQKYYRRGDSVVSAVGRLDMLPTGTLDALASALPAGATQAFAVHIPELKGTSHELIAHRDVTAPWLVAQYSAPSIESKDFGPMLVIAAWFQRTLSSLVQVPGVVSTTFASRSVGVIYNYDRNPASLDVYVDGAIGSPARTFGTALSIVSVLTSTKLVGPIDDFKSMAYGDFTTNATTLESRAWLAAVFAQNGASPDFVNRAMAAINATTPDDLQRVAKAYLGNPTVALVLPRQQGN